MIKLYDLCGADRDLRFSPYCWRTKMCLKHKGLPFDTVPWNFTDKAAIASSGQPRVPVIDDGGKIVHDSFDIALYLDDAYPARPPLMTTDAERAAARFLENWAAATLHPTLIPQVIVHIHDVLDDIDQSYFRETREKALKAPLETVALKAGEAQEHMAQILRPVEHTLKSNAWLSGDNPGFFDYILFGSLQWPHAVSTQFSLPEGSRTAEWFSRCQSLYDGYARLKPQSDFRATLP